MSRILSQVSPKKSAAILLSLCMLAGLPACTTASLGDGTPQAYNTSGLIQVPTYTRTIFSSTNF